MNIQAVAERLQALVVLNGRVGIGVDEEDAYGITQSMGAYPSAVLLGPKESATTEQTTAGPRHLVTSSIGLVIAVKAAGDYKAGQRAAALREALKPVRGAMVGFVPDEDEWPLEFVGGQLIYAETGFLLWRDEYRNHFILEAD